MRKSTEGTVRIGSSRTGAAKKFADWPIRMPGGQDALFAVTFRENGENVVFQATSTHPWFKDVLIEADDPNRIRRDIEELARERIAREREGTWAPGTLVSVVTKRTRNEGQGRQSLEFQLDLEEIEFLQAVPIGNRGQTSIRTEFSQKVIFQRGPEDRFENAMDEARSIGLSGSLRDREAAAFWSDPIRQETGTPMTRVIVPDDSAQVEVLADTIERFLRAFGARMAPGRRAIEGVPSPDDLVELMRQSLPGSE